MTVFSLIEDVFVFKLQKNIATLFYPLRYMRKFEVYMIFVIGIYSFSCQQNKEIEYQQKDTDKIKDYIKAIS